MKLEVIARYAGVGLAGFGVDLATFTVLSAGVPAVIARGVAIFAAVSVTYVGHRYWTFQKAARTDFFGAYGQFLVSNAGTCLLNAAVSLGVLALLPPGFLPSLLAVAAGGFCALVGNYFVARHWVFPSGSEEDGAATQDGE